MLKVSILVSAYYCMDYLGRKIKEMNMLPKWVEVIYGCLRNSPEHIYLSTRISPNSIILCDDKPTGLYGTWNNLIEHASTPLLLNSNTDDTLYLSGLIDLIKASTCPAGIFFGKVRNVHPTYTDFLPFKKNITKKDMYSRSWPGPMPLWKKSLHEKYGLFKPELTICGDWEFWLRCAYHDEQIKPVPSISGSFLNRDDSLGNGNLPLRSSQLKAMFSLYPKQL